MNDDARYLYCVTENGADINFGNIGIEEKTVYTIPYRDITAVVHSCLPSPYITKDNSEAEGWLLEHNYVIDQAMRKFGTVLPFSFDVIVRGDDETIRVWLDQNYDRLLNELKRLHKKAEYAVQIFYDYDIYVSKVLCSDQNLRSSKEKIDKQGKGKAYLLKRNLDLKIKDAVTSYVENKADLFGLEIKSIADLVKTEKKISSIPAKYKDKKLMASFSCLVHQDKIEQLGMALENINNQNGLAVRFTGPWAPFSFVDIEGLG